MKDTVILTVLLALLVPGIAYVTTVPPGGLIRALGGEHPGRHLRPADAPRTPHARPLTRHAAPRALPAAPAGPRALPAPSSVTTIPDPKPFVRTA